MKKRKYHLTRHAAIILHEIYTRSLNQWGQGRADKYMVELYAAMMKAAAKPEIGRLRAHRTAPFLMIPAGQHFIVYDRLGHDIVILTLLHQRRDIERIVTDLTPAFLAEILALREGGV
jgi:plasmid stabilization system protein ParE